MILESESILKATKTEQGTAEKMAYALMRFEADDFFIRFCLLHVASFEEAEQIVGADPKIVIQNGWLFLGCPGGGLFTWGEGEDTADECGRWLEEADRDSLDDFLDSTLELSDFIRLCPAPERFRLVRFVLSESTREYHTQLWRTARSQHWSERKMGLPEREVPGNLVLGNACSKKAYSSNFVSENTTLLPITPEMQKQRHTGKRSPQ